MISPARTAASAVLKQRPRLARDRIFAKDPADTPEQSLPESLSLLVGGTGALESSLAGQDRTLSVSVALGSRIRAPYMWELGDVSLATGQVMVQTYATPPTHAVKVRAFFPGGTAHYGTTGSSATVTIGSAP
jgi:hypothetical protein